MLPLLKTSCSTDPAVDVHGTGVEGFREFHRSREERHLKMWPGKTPAVYSIKRIGRGVLFGWVMTAPNDDIKFQRAFAVGCVRGEGFVSDRDGRHVAYLEHNPSKAVRVGSDDVATFDDQELDEFPKEDILEIGEVAFAHAFLRHGIEPCYPVPLSFPAALERAARRSRPAE